MRFRGVEYTLVYNAAAHYNSIEKYGEGGLLKAVADSGKTGFDATCWALEELSTQGELIRRDMGYDRAEPIREADARKYLRPVEIVAAKTAIIDAVTQGMETKVNSDREIDLGLLELQKKTDA